MQNEGRGRDGKGDEERRKKGGGVGTGPPIG